MHNLVAIKTEFAYAYNSMNNTAIIIKKLYPHDHKVALIDQKKGRINGIVHNKPIMEGSIVQYNPKYSHTHTILQDVEYLYVPLAWGKQDLLFMHHVLEICYFLIPLYSCTEGIFDLLCFLFRMQELSWTMTAQKIFLCRLFLLLGMYPQTAFLKTNIAMQLLYVSLEDMLQLKINDQEQMMIDEWLKRCIVQHHREFDFKTMNFLQRAGK